MNSADRSAPAPHTRRSDGETPTKPSETEFLLYETGDGKTRIDVRMLGETVWLSLPQLTDLFGRDKSVISRHIKNVYEEGELTREATVALFATVQTEGQREVQRETEHYNLDVIISVGYRVRSQRGMQFRIWATHRLREYLIKGFAMDDERLKAAGGGRYFDELLARIRDIRSSEKVFWRKVLEIYATSIDYDPQVETTQQFFATVQSKMHWAAHGHTAAARQRVDKYAYLATPAEVAENDFNLNIPRYIDTFEEEEEIDLMAARREREELKTELVKLEEQMAAYLKELGYE